MVYLSCELRLDGNSKVSRDCCAKNLSIWRFSWAFRLFRSLSISSAVLGGLEAEVVLGLAKVLSFFELWKDEIEFYSRRVGLFMTLWDEKGRGLNWRALHSFYIFLHHFSWSWARNRNKECGIIDTWMPPYRPRLWGQVPCLPDAGCRGLREGVGTAWRSWPRPEPRCVRSGFWWKGRGTPFPRYKSGKGASWPYNQ